VLSEPEVVIAGQAAAVFQDACTGGGASAGQSEAFLEAYQSARERAFSKAELHLLALTRIEVEAGLALRGKIRQPRDAHLTRS
jgi:hypothetical protein